MVIQMKAKSLITVGLAATLLLTGCGRGSGDGEQQGDAAALTGTRKGNCDGMGSGSRG